ncbi:alpha-2-macroglobulin [Ginsengibacter hankyongi]|uniref:Alpha-2-macroglobulin n=1 Tax=Ginsengibacter hankyongi TaxID=2607284 RepID=A0A5J5INP2_9BACT|nr:MG2 domain-containing protein [Ginsengibacter hankyongi]KAA9041544.1 alpha-2-macroglobulin [Ginsengibacter hankyongi]
MHFKNYLIRGLSLVVIVSFGFSALYAQQPSGNYASQWKKIDDLVGKGLTKSALAEVNKIYSLSKKASNEPQVIKALLYKITLQQNIEEDATVKSIDTFELEIASSKEPARSILESITAEMYWNFFQQQRWKIYNRTKTQGFKKDDILTWTANDFHEKIAKLYQASIKEEKLLQQTTLEPFDAIIIKGNARYSRPTLYDLLAHRALDYFKSDENNITRPAYAFEIKDEKAFAPASEFVMHKFENKDSASLHFKALLIFQHLLSFHASDSKPDALIDADIERINFVKQYGIMNNKDELYIVALQNISNTFSNNAASAQAGYLIAQQIFEKANANQKNTDTSRYTVKKAKQIAEAIANKFPGSEGGINAKNLLNQILHKDVSLTSEKVNIPSEPFRTLVTYKNFSSLNFRIIEMTPKFKKLIERNDDNDQLWKKLTTQTFIRSWKQNLLATDDYLSHSVEIKVDGLPVGQYALLASVAGDFDLDKNPLAVQYFHVSNISYINNGLEYFILDRKTGQPLDGAKVQVWKQKYDYSTQKNTVERKEFLTADEHGYLKISGNKKDENNSFRLEIFYQKDHLFLDEYQYSYNYDNETDDDYDNQQEYDEDKAKIFLFTDRSIYRPGQLVYFKGIGVTQDYKTKKNKLLQNKDSIKIYLNDANSQKVDSLKLLLNEYGSFNGKFHLPENKLNGEFSIEVDDYENSSIDFSVEEYKRPKFYTEFEKVKGTYRVGDSVSITGFAKAYAGNNIDDANVTYRVTRVARFLYPWMFWRWPQPVSQPLEITNGETTTDANGKFTLNFAAIPDLSIDKNTDPVFDYKVEANVTDINGETRSTNAIVPAGYKALNLQLTLPSEDAIPVDSLKYIFVSTKNLSGEFEPSKVEVKIYKLQPPQRLIRSRYWPQPDEFIMTREEFLKYFPNDEYQDENKKESWPKGEMVFSKTDSTKPIGNWQLADAKFSQGWYVAEATSKDKYGQDVKDVKYFQLYDMNAASLPAPSYAWNTTIKNVVEPGENAEFISGTSAKDVFVIQQIDKEQTGKGQKPIGNYEFYSLSNEKKNFGFKAAEDDRGGFGVSQFFVKDNRIYFRCFNILVPWSNKDLNISFDTYRDKTLPGSEEKWKVKISGHKGQKVAAEMLASMYDASLDQFKPHSWNALNIWPTHYGYQSWNGSQNFSSVQSTEKYWNEKYIEQTGKSYDALNYIPVNNYLQGKVSGIRIRGNAIAYDKAAAPAEMNKADLSGVLVTGYGLKKIGETKELMSATVNIKNDKNSENLDQSQIQIRKNFNETAFFYPELRTDKDGNIEFSFTMPEALTQWKLMTLAHTKDLATGYAENTIVTQKDLMVQPNAPRFLREGDHMEFTAKIVNLGDKEVSGQAELHLLNASTMNPVDEWFKNNIPAQNFTAKAGQSTLVKFNIEIPANFNDAVVYRIVAKAGDVSDGEELAIPVVTNRMLVTETMPLPMRGDGAKDFKFEKLINSKSSSTLSSYGLTIEYTTNPAWYAIQALPYLMEYPYECAEQTFNRYYANAIATKIVNSSPKIKAIFEKWKTTDTTALLSNLQKNEELKSVLLEETPWVLQAQNEQKQKKNIALLFDMVKMSLQLESALQKLSEMQSSNGGFVWFKGGPDNRYMTQYIVTGIGHLKKLNAYPSFQQNELKTILDKAIPYLDKMLKKDYDDLIKSKSNLKGNHLSTIAIQYLYMRSFFPEYSIAKETQTAFNYYRKQSKKYWLNQSKYMQAMIALSINRTNDNAIAKNIIKSLKENSIDNEELGMYWKDWNNGGYWWYQAPIESQSMMIEAFSEIEKDPKTIDDLKTWLLKNKQTNNWKTTKATAEACYAFLLQGTDWLSQEKIVSIKLGNTIINNKNEKQEAGTGYFKRKIDGDKVNPEMGNISVTVSSPVNQSTNEPINQSASWGSVYWQYFENLDKITFSETPLKLSKKLFIEKNSVKGPGLVPVNDGDKIRIGDKIKVRIELRVDRDMEYVHMKDMRASCMEPTNVISAYKYQDGLGYYETTKDVSTNFFFGYLNKGTYVFEYPMFVTHSGNFSNGITTIQSMYAPEFTAHSEGVRVSVGE